MHKRDKSKKNLNRILITALFIATIFMNAGYAAINIMNLNIDGELIAQAQDGIFITEVENIANNNAYLFDSKITSAAQNILESTVALSETDVNSSITYKLKIYNSLDKTYIFTGATYDKEFYSNDNIIFEISDAKIGDKILSKDYINISITFKYKNDVNLKEDGFNNILKSFIKFNFELNPNPVLSENMIPVYYDSGVWKKIEQSSNNWHNYIEKKWANAITYNKNVIYNQVENDTELKVFNGSSDYIILGSEEYDFNKNVTAVARVKLYSYSDSESGIVGNPNSAGFYMIKRPNNKFGFEFYDETTKKWIIIDSNLTPELNTWYTVVGTYDGNILKIYIDGKLDNSMEFKGSIKVSLAPIAIGANPDDDGTMQGGYFHGAISETIVMPKTLTETEISENYSNPIKHKPDSHNTMYYLKFDANNAITNNSPSYENDGMLFDGVNDYANVGYSSYNFKNNFTVGARVKIYSYSDGEYGIIGNPESAGFYLLKSSDNKFELIIYDTKTDAYIRVKAPNTFQLNTWYTVIGTFDGSNMKLFINGTLVKTISQSISMKLSNIPIMIGVNPTINYSLGGSYLDGTISDIILINEALTDQQISTNYSNSLNTVISDKTLLSFDLRSYESRSNDTTIPNEMINGMWTWIPRLSATSPINTGIIDVKFVEKEKKSHDAFNFDGEEIDGFWIGKFENSTLYDTDSRITINANKKSLANKNISTMFNDINSITSKYDIYGFNSTNKTILDTHLSKNREWAALSYLTQSKYGLCNYDSCNELEKNENQITGGNNYTQNTSQSTTGNIYGVYDINGGVEEYVMGNYQNTKNSLDGFTTLPESKYIDTYTTEENYSNNNLQHALIETNILFNNGNGNFITSTNNWLTRHNLFSYQNNTGAANTTVGSRTTLIVK